MLVAVRSEDSGGYRRGAGGWLLDLADDGTPTGESGWAGDLAAAVRAREDPGSAGPAAPTGPRWLWPATWQVYPRLLRAGVRVRRCHDAELAEALLLGSAGRWGEPRSLAAAWARLTGRAVPADRPLPAAAPPGAVSQASLFDAVDPGPAFGAVDPGPAFDAAAAGGLDVLVRVHRDQRARCAGTPEPGRLRLLIAAESAGALVAAEMGHHGLPWRADVHDRILRDLLGDPSPVGGPPRRLAELSGAIAEAFGQRVHPESPAELLRAFSRLGIVLPSTQIRVLQRVEHPVVPLLLEYKELYRIWTAHGWSWCEQWVRDGRFRPEYVPGGVVSGRWATRGGGALQIPRVIRRAVVADPGWTLVVADAGQLEPRVLAAVSGDRRLARAAGTGDLYASLAADSFGGERARAKVALLGAMYGQTGGQAAPALAVLRREYPTAWEYVEAAARTGEAGGLVRSWLGRTCPPASAAFDGAPADGAPGAALAPTGSAGAQARARGRFTRNFVIQATAAEWALVLLAELRTRLWGGAAQLVFFQHDEVVVHCPVGDAAEVVAAVREAGEAARRLLFGDTPVRFPLDVATVGCYADAK